MPSNHLILCHPLLLPYSIFPSIRVFSNESVLHIRWPSTGASVSASVLPMNIQDWFLLGLTDLISLQPKGLSRVSNTTVQHHRSKASSLCHSAFTVQLSHQMKEKKNICHCKEAPIPIPSWSKSPYSKVFTKPHEKVVYLCLSKIFFFSLSFLFCCPFQNSHKWDRVINFLFWLLLQKYLQTLMQKGKI